ncbi:MAG TPA: DUF1674 domain-containing protein [Sphingomonas sp.]|jgi:hypothetical protein|uniref:DUF1674 domain-containing protein n=1 Tax=Sphingomonas sp. TaxID=28214 RepID=UPI002EDA8C95
MPRPANFVPPRNLSPNPPVPEPQPIIPEPESGGRNGPDPTRYGDWENKGIAVDF